jgi:phosphoribosylaminoimidazole-succinocarboxamide synthase
MIVKKAERIDIECVARGYLVGSGYKDYKKIIDENPGAKEINLYGSKLSADIPLAGKLEKPIFTPSTKEDTGHDINISVKATSELVGEKLTRQLEEATLGIYTKAYEYAYPKGIIIADTKFEFGFLNGELTLIDEILSPDSSRFWPVDSYKIGSNPPSFDKQFIRDYLEKTGWDKNSAPPELPEDVIEKTSEIYKKAYSILVGSNID